MAQPARNLATLLRQLLFCNRMHGIYGVEQMKLNTLLLGAGLAAAASVAQADQPRLLGCYQRVLVPAQYHVKKTKIKDAERKYVKRNGRYELLEYPAVYEEHKTLIKGEYYVMREISCN